MLMLMLVIETRELRSPATAGKLWARPTMLLVAHHDRSYLAWVDEPRRREDIRNIRRNSSKHCRSKNQRVSRRGIVHEDGDEVEFVTLLRFDSMDGVKEFAGADASKPVIYPKAEALITRMVPARHYRVA